MLFVLLFLPALILFVIPCLLSWRWLGVFTVLSGIGLAFLWQDNMAHRGEGNGIAEAFSIFTLYGMTVGTGAGIVARVAMLGLRRRQVRWKFAWLPAPIILALVVGWHAAQIGYDQWRRRPPSDACLAATRDVSLSGAMLRIPTAPLFTLTLDGDRLAMFNLAWPPDDVRTLCRLTAQGRVLELKRLKLDFVRHVPGPNRHWPDVFCRSVRNRAWLDRFCTGPVDIQAEHYPRELVFEASDTMAKDGAFRPLWQTLQGSQPEAEHRRRLRMTEGNWLAISCGGNGANCYGAFEPRPGLGVRFLFSTSAPSADTDALAIAARVSEIAADLAWSPE